MNKSIPTSKAIGNWKSLRKIARQDQEGMALVLALLLGMVMMAGVSGLLARQLMSRRLSAKESYQQMAEAAANNGLNRILGVLNNAEPDQNRGFLFTLDNRENINEPNNGFSWERLNTDSPPTFSELCLDTSIDLPLHPDAKANAIWPTSEVPLNEENSPSMRDDGISKIETFYRLRGYSSPGTSGSTDSGEAKFIIEGLVRRKGADHKSYLARSRLERSLYIQSWVDINRSKDWAALAASYYELGPLQLNNPGLIIWHADQDQATAIRRDCNSSSMIDRLGGKRGTSDNLASRIWPIVNQKQPPSSIFKTDGAKDRIPGQSSDLRVWKIDDTNLNPRGNCWWRVLCQRDSRASSYTRPSNIDSRRWWRRVNNRWQPTATIRLKEKDICTGSKGDCHIYVDQINLNRSQLLIENGSRPVVVHLLGSAQGQTTGQASTTGTISLGANALICGVDVNSTTCNNKPERLIITTEATQAPVRCNSTDHRLVLNGNSLPSAWVLMRKGTVALANNSELNGVIWTHSFCSNNHRLVLNEGSRGLRSGSNFQKASILWDWSGKGFAGYGRKTTRGIRGTGLDQFQRF